ncbi:hypothetical protein [Runella sp.]|uniref:hypothetical protein n=1 Tax=Runella sp. TaxID=1960881 RepID=UPI003D0AD6C5
MEKIKPATTNRVFLSQASANPLGILFDAVFLAFNFLAEPLLHRYLLDRLFADTAANKPDLMVGALVLGAIVAQGLGLYLRRKRAAEAVQNNRLWDSWFALPIFFILIFHFALFGIFLVIVGVVSIDPDAKGWEFLLCVPVVLFMTWWAIQNTRPDHYRKPSLQDRVEDGFGTLLLIFSGIVLTTIAWSGLITNNVLQGTFAEDSIGDKVSYTLLLLLFFGMYYLPARLSFLVCDFNKPQTWLRYGLVFLPLARKIWFG